MGIVKTKGIVIKECQSGDTDKVLTVFSAELGKITVYAKGVKRSGNKFNSASQLFCYSDFILFKGREMYYINSAEVLHVFYDVRKDMTILTYAAHMVDVLLDVVQENQAYPDIMTLFLKTLHYLTKTGRKPALITAVFVLKLLCQSGYAPTVDRCGSCGSKDMEELFFSYGYSGFLCERCAGMTGHVTPVSTGVAKALVYVLFSDLKMLFGFDLTEENLQLFEKIVYTYLNIKLEKEYSKLQFLKELTCEPG